MELITKTPEQFTGSRYLIEGGKEVSLAEIGAPNGTTFLVKNLFYNTPVPVSYTHLPQCRMVYLFADCTGISGCSNPGNFKSGGKSVPVQKCDLLSADCRWCY